MIQLDQGSLFVYGSNNWKELDELDDVEGIWNWGNCGYTIFDVEAELALDISLIRSASVVRLPVWAFLAILLRMSSRGPGPLEPWFTVPVDDLSMWPIATPPLASTAVGLGSGGETGASVGKVTFSEGFRMGFPVTQSRDSSDILTSVATHPSLMILQFGRGVKFPAFTPILEIVRVSSHKCTCFIRKLNKKDGITDWTDWFCITHFMLNMIKIIFFYPQQCRWPFLHSHSLHPVVVNLEPSKKSMPLNSQIGTLRPVALK